MKVDKSKSIYHESPLARVEFNRRELKRLRLILRRLQYLEAMMEENTKKFGNPNGNGGEMWVEWEVEALEWILDEMEYLSPRADGGLEGRDSG